MVRRSAFQRKIWQYFPRIVHLKVANFRKMQELSERQDVYCNCISTHTG